MQEVFGNDIDFGQVIKRYDGRGLYVRSEKKIICGRPKHITTSHVESMNQTIRTNNRRYTRKGTTVSKKMENHIYSLAMQFVHYNFCRPHTSLGEFVTPAMAEGIVDEMYDYEWMVRLGDGTVEYPPEAETMTPVEEPVVKQIEEWELDTSGGIHRPRNLRRIDLGK